MDLQRIMTQLYPFRALRPSPGQEAQVDCAPYDTMNREEAVAMATGRPHSFLHVDRPDIHFPAGHDPHLPEVYQRARSELARLMAEGALRQDLTDCFTIYRQTMEGRQQTGLVCTALTADYDEGIIKKHEFTRPDKEDDRLAHIEATACQCSPVFLAYRSDAEIDAQIAAPDMRPPDVDLTDDLGVRHELWLVTDPEHIDGIQTAFQPVDFLYVADGHHRSAAASRCAAAYPERELAQRFLVVIFPHNQLHVMDYNRVVHDLNGLTAEGLIERLSEDFEVSRLEREDNRSPDSLRNVGMYLDGQWYRLSARHHTFEGMPCVEALDVAILQRHVLTPLLGIEDPRVSDRISFVGGIRGMDELERRVDARGQGVAFSMFPTPMEALLQVADDNDIMPPKSTWFEPKLRSGLFVNPILDLPTAP